MATHRRLLTHFAESGFAAVDAAVLDNVFLANRPHEALGVDAPCSKRGSLFGKLSAVGGNAPRNSQRTGLP